MKKKILAIISCLTLCAFCFVGCGKKEAKFGFAQELIEFNPTEARSITLGSGVNLDSENGASTRGNIVVWKEVSGSKQYGIYSLEQSANANSNGLILGFTSESLEICAESFEKFTDYFSAYNGSTYTIYNEKGNVLYSDLNNFEIEREVYGKTCYEFFKLEKNGKTTIEFSKINKKGKRTVYGSHTFEKGSNPVLLQDCHWLGHADKDGVDKIVTNTTIGEKNFFQVFNSNLKKVADYNFENPDYMVGFGKYGLIQYQRYCDYMSDDYDVLLPSSGEKYELETFIFDVITGKIKEIDDDFFMTSNSCFATKDYACVKAYEIDDEIAKDNIDRVVMVNSKGKITFSEYAIDATDIMKINDNRFIAQYGDDVVMLNRKGEIVFYIPDSDFHQGTVCEDYVVISDGTNQYAVDLNGNIVSNIYDINESVMIMNGKWVAVRYSNVAGTTDEKETYYLVDDNGNETEIGSRVVDSSYNVKSAQFKGVAVKNLIVEYYGIFVEREITGSSNVNVEVYRYGDINKPLIQVTNIDPDYEIHFDTFGEMDDMKFLLSFEKNEAGNTKQLASYVVE